MTWREWGERTLGMLERAGDEAGEGGEASPGQAAGPGAPQEGPGSSLGVRVSWLSVSAQARTWCEVVWAALGRQAETAGLWGLTIYLLGQASESPGARRRCVGTQGWLVGGLGPELQRGLFAQCPRSPLCIRFSRGQVVLGLHCRLFPRL